MRNAGRRLLFCLAVVSLQALAQSPETPGWRVTDPVSPTQSAPDPGYAKDALSTSITGARAVIGPGDLLDISVFDTPELAQRARVNGDGKITLALVGEIFVKGMTADEVAKWCT